MWKLVLLVLNDPTRLNQLLEVWEQAGVRGATIIESLGLARSRGYLHSDTPLFPSIQNLLQSERETNLTLFAIVADSLDTDLLLQHTEAVIGDLAQPETGVFFILPLEFVKGVRNTPD